MRNDPVTWWDWSLALHKPDWLSEPRGRDVSPSIHWIPVITMLQLAADQMVANDVPNGDRTPVRHCAGRRVGHDPAAARLGPPPTPRVWPRRSPTNRAETIRLTRAPALRSSGGSSPRGRPRGCRCGHPCCGGRRGPRSARAPAGRARPPGSVDAAAWPGWPARLGPRLRLRVARLAHRAQVVHLAHRRFTSRTLRRATDSSRRARRRRGGGDSGEGGAQAGGVDPPEVVLPAVDEGHRDLLAVAGARRLGVGGDVDLVVGLAQLGADLLDHRAGVVAQVAARAWSRG